MNLIFFPPPLDHSVITAVWISLIFSCYFNLRFGWVFSGLVCSGYLAPLLVADPRAVVLIYIEAIITYILVKLINNSGFRYKVWTSFFGRDRFFVIILISIFVRLLFDLVILPVVLENEFLLGSININLNQIIANKSIGLVVIPLLANSLWKTGVYRGVYSNLVNLCLLYVTLVYGLTSISNFSIVDLSYFYESFSVGIDASPKAYIVLIVTAYLGSIYNLKYGWDFSGILVPALMALTINYPTKIIVTVFEAVAIYWLGVRAVNLPGLNKINFIGARKTFLFFTIGYAIKYVLSYSLDFFDVTIKTSDFFGFGYLLSTLLAIKFTSKNLVIGTIRATVQVTLMSGLAGFLLGFILYKANIGALLFDTTSIEISKEEKREKFEYFLSDIKSSFYYNNIQEENFFASFKAIGTLYKKFSYEDLAFFSCLNAPCYIGDYLVQSDNQSQTTLVLDLSVEEFSLYFDKIFNFYIGSGAKRLVLQNIDNKTLYKKWGRHQIIKITVNEKLEKNTLNVLKGLEEGINFNRLTNFFSNWSKNSRGNELTLGAPFLNSDNYSYENLQPHKKDFSQNTIPDDYYSGSTHIKTDFLKTTKDKASKLYFKKEVLDRILVSGKNKKIDFSSSCRAASVFGWFCVSIGENFTLLNKIGVGHLSINIKNTKSKKFILHEISDFNLEAIDMLQDLLRRNEIFGFYAFKKDQSSLRNFYYESKNSIDLVLFNSLNEYISDKLLTVYLLNKTSLGKRIMILPSGAVLKSKLPPDYVDFLEPLTLSLTNEDSYYGEYSDINYVSKLNMRKFINNYVAIAKLPDLDFNKDLISNYIKNKHSKIKIGEKNKLNISESSCKKEDRCASSFQYSISINNEKYLIIQNYKQIFEHCVNKNILNIEGVYGCKIE